MRYLSVVVRLLLAVVLAVLVAVPPSVTFAQDDWSITRERGRGRGRGQTQGTGRGRGRGRTGAGATATPGEQPGEQSRDTARSGVLIARYMRVLEADPRESFALQRLLDLYRDRDGNIDQLVRELEQRVHSDANAFAAHMLLGHVYKTQSRSTEARQMYERAATLRPNDPAPLVAAGALEHAASRLPEARALYDRALAQTRDHTARQELLRTLGELALEAHDYDAARARYGELGRGSEGSVYLATEYARALASRNDFVRAVAEYQRVLRSLRGDNRVVAPVLRDMGRAQLDAGDTPGALATLERALTMTGSQGGVRREIYEILVEAYRRSERLPELAQRLSREGHGSFESNELLGRVYDELGNEADALAAYRRALQSNGRNIDTRLRVVQLLTRSGRIPEVVAEYRTLIRMAPREPRFVVELAQLMMQTGQREDALRLAAETSRRYAREPAVHEALAELYARWNEEALAAQEVATLARIEPGDPAHLVALGAQQLEAGNREAALATWRRILHVDSDRARAHATLGGIYADHDMLQEAVDEYKEATRLDDDQIEYARGLATVLERLRRDEEAVTEWRRVLRLGESDRAAKREARQRIVAIWARNRQLPARTAEFERAFAARPPDVEAGRFLAEAYRRQGPDKQADAERILERIIQLEPGDVESLLALERVRTARGNLSGAIDTLRRLAEADPRRARSYLGRMAEHALALYHDEEAIRYAARAVELAPDDATAHQRLGDLYRARQDMDRAVRSYRRAIELNDRLYATYFDLAEIHLARGELREADTLFRRVMRTSPDDDLVQRATRSSIQINLGAGTLEDLERDLLPLALGNPQRPLFRRLVVELYEGLASALVERARQPGEPGREARTRLGRIGTRAVKPLLEALADADPTQRRVAIEILAEVGNENAAAPLLAAAEAEGDAELRRRALVAAGAVAPASLTTRFVELSDGPERRLRDVATWALGRIGGRAAVAALRQKLTASDPAVRAYAALGLGRARDRASADELERMLREDRSIEAQAAAAWALGEVGDATRVAALVAALRGRGGIAGRAAAHALGTMAARPGAASAGQTGATAQGGADAADVVSARDALAEALFDPETDQRAGAAAALLRLATRSGEDQGARSFPPPAASMTASDYVAFLMGAGAADGTAPVDLRRHRDAIVAAAREALRGPIERRAAVLDVLGAGSRGLALGPLTQGISRWPGAAQTAARAELASMGEALLPDIVRVARQSDVDLRVRAVALLAKIEHEDAVDGVIAALDDPEPSVQRAALDALASLHRLAPANAAQRSANILRRHADWATRARAAATLGALARGGSAATPIRAALAEALRRDGYAFVREAAARALGDAGAAGAIEPLSRALMTDPEPLVRIAAARALRRIGGPEATQALDTAQRQGDARVRDAIRRSSQR